MNNLEKNQEMDPLKDIEGEKVVEKYFLNTLQFTPDIFVKKSKYAEIRAKMPEGNDYTIKIFRAVGGLLPAPGDLEEIKEFEIQDEITIPISESKPRYQVNFTVLVNRDDYTYKSIREKPTNVSKMKDSLNVLDNLVKHKGSVLYSEYAQMSIKFVSDGEKWVLVKSA